MFPTLLTAARNWELCGAVKGVRTGADENKRDKTGNKDLRENPESLENPFTFSGGVPGSSELPSSRRRGGKVGASPVQKGGSITGLPQGKWMSLSRREWLWKSQGSHQQRRERLIDLGEELHKLCRL